MQLQQLPDLQKGEAEAFAAFDEPDGLQMALVVAAVARDRPGRRRQKTLALIESYGLNIQSGLLRDLSDAHADKVP